jgi:hypothetical protein
MSRARQNLAKRIRSSTNEAESQALVARLSPKKRKKLGLPAPEVTT